MKPHAYIKIFALLAVLPAYAPAATESVSDPAAGLGRLFMSQDKRAMLDAARARNLPTNNLAEYSKLRLDGIVVRSDGRKTVWLNGTPMHDRMPVERVGTNSARVIVSPGHAVDLPVGSTIQFVSDTSQ
ncbi:MAG: hypothetical protein FWD62_05115 [Betaproteobacteria bacterium]|nr:hypothetical protein [Betaproteobacteria bacterium]